MYNLGQNSAVGGRFTKMRVPETKHLTRLKCDVAFLQRTAPRHRSTAGPFASMANVQFRALPVSPVNEVADSRKKLPERSLQSLQPISVTQGLLTVTHRLRRDDSIERIRR